MMILLPENLNSPSLSLNTLPETNIFAPKNWMVGILLSYWVSAYFQGLSLLVSGRVTIGNCPHSRDSFEDFDVPLTFDISNLT